MSETAYELFPDLRRFYRPAPTVKEPVAEEPEEHESCERDYSADEFRPERHGQEEE